jgi:mono/diheme cytochrome c family protein
MIKKILISICIVHFTACGAGKGNGLDNQGLPIKDKAGEQPPSQNNGVTLASLQQNIFGAICTNCHTGSNAPRGLRLDSEENSYAFLVKHAADEVPELMRVNPGNPNTSYIIRKLEGASGIVGSRMPLGGPYLNQVQINSVRDWIANGAPRTGTGTSPTKISDIKLEKIDSQFLASLHLSRSLETNSVTEKNFTVSYTAENSNTPMPINNFNLLVLDQSLELIIPTTLDVSTITITLKSPTEAPVLDAQLHSIDGDDGDNQGGEYHYELTHK